MVSKLMTKTFKQIYSLRVNQIDSKLLDNELNSLIESKLNDFETDLLRVLSQHLLPLIKYYLWFHTIRRNGISIGHSLLQLRYYDLSENQIKDNLKTYQSYGIVLTQILIPYIKQNTNYFIKNQIIRNGFEVIENIYKTFDFINSLLFLYYGKYRSFWERMLELGTGLQSVQSMSRNNDLYLEIMNRELLWHTFAEFLTFVLPLINFYRLKNSLKYYMFGSNACVETNVKLRDTTDLTNCVICNEWPINAHEIGCRHVFCYYCLMSNFMADQINGFSCGQCFYVIHSIDSIKRVKIFIN